MTKNIFIASAEPYTGKSVIAFGMINMLLAKTQKVGYFKPIIAQDDPNKKDEHVEAMLDYFSLPVKYEDAFAFTRQEMLHQSEDSGTIINTIISKYKKLEDNYDFTVIEGSDFLGEGMAFEFESNALMAKNLGAPVLIVVSGKNKTASQLFKSAINIYRNFLLRDVQVLGVVANMVNPEEADRIKQALSNQLPAELLIAVIPTETGLQSPTMKEITLALGGEVLFGSELLDNQVDNFVTGAMMLPDRKSVV